MFKSYDFYLNTPCCFRILTTWHSSHSDSRLSLSYKTINKLFIKDVIDSFLTHLLVCPPCSSPLQAYWKTLNQMLQKLSQRLALMSQGEESIVKVSLNASSISDKLVAFKTKPPPIQKDMLSICNDPYTLAQQLTHVELVSPEGGRVVRRGQTEVRGRDGNEESGCSEA